jgi:ATP-dependent Clp protease adaptor protein ClpS
MAQASHEDIAEMTRLKSPPKFNVILMNDEATPQEFVVNVLRSIFNRTSDEAEAVMLEVHNKGRGIAGTYSYEVAEQKCVETITDARRNSYPLDVTLEKTE